MLSGTSCLLLAVCALYLLIQSLVNFRTFSASCEGTAVASFFNLVNLVVAVLTLLFFAWRSSQGGL